KFLSEQEIKAIREKTNAQSGDLILIVGDTDNGVVFDSLGALRNHLAAKLGLIEEGTFDFLWVTKFPLFEYDSDEKRYVAKHHPFTSPLLEDVDKVTSDPANAHARAYDMVLNGYELGGGSIRISDPVLQETMFSALGFTQEQAHERFGFLLDAFKYGVPPHGGMAFGLDRLVMLMTGKTNIRDVIAFPKVQNATELMSMCPSPVEEKNLVELGIEVSKVEE
ncbi:MAG: amino acid--tRNA ligase-related protein, partial [Oscillospiraceae bacterium]